VKGQAFARLVVEQLKKGRTAWRPKTRHQEQGEQQALDPLLVLGPELDLVEMPVTAISGSSVSRRIRLLIQENPSGQAKRVSPVTCQ